MLKLLINARHSKTGTSHMCLQQQPAEQSYRTFVKSNPKWVEKEREKKRKAIAKFFALQTNAIILQISLERK